MERPENFCTYRRRSKGIRFSWNRSLLRSSNSWEREEGRIEVATNPYITSFLHREVLRTPTYGCLNDISARNNLGTDGTLPNSGVQKMAPQASADSCEVWGRNPREPVNACSLTYLGQADAQQPASNGSGPDSADVGGDSVAVEVCL